VEAAGLARSRADADVTLDNLGHPSTACPAVIPATLEKLVETQTFLRLNATIHDPNSTVARVAGSVVMVNAGNKRVFSHFFSGSPGDESGPFQRVHKIADFVHLNFLFVTDPATPNPTRKNWFGWVSLTLYHKSSPFLSRGPFSCAYERRIRTRVGLNSLQGGTDLVNDG
jgi:hypothetical protein